MSSKGVPDLKEYEHLSEKERMLAGFPYCAGGPELTKERIHARTLVQAFNTSKVENQSERQEILKKLFHPDTHEQIFIEPNFRCDYGYNISFGENLQMNFDCCILDCARVKIGKNCFVAPGVHIYAAYHPLDGQERLKYELASPVTLGDNVWIGGKAMILPGVTIGDNVTIGAGSVVTKSIPSNSVVAGNPARIIRKLD